MPTQDKNHNDVRTSESRRLNRLERRIKCLSYRDSRNRSQFARILPASMVIIGTLLVAITQALHFLFSAPPEGGWNFVWGSLIIIGAFFGFFGALWIFFVENSLPGALETANQALEEARNYRIENEIVTREHDELNDQISEYIKNITDNSNWKNQIYILQNTLLEYIENFLRTGKPPENTDLRQVLDDNSRILSELMKFQPGEYWSISIYKATHKGSDAVLECVANHRAQRNEEVRGNRSWRLGEGVAGDSLKRETEVVLSDAGDPTEARWLHVTYGPDDDRKKESDKRKYRSLAAVPIKVRRRVWGVIVGTSDIPKRFLVKDDGTSGDEIEPLRMIARVIAVAQAPFMNEPTGGISVGEPHEPL